MHVSTGHECVRTTKGPTLNNPAHQLKDPRAINPQTIATCVDTGFPRECCLFRFLSIPFAYVQLHSTDVEADL